MKKNTVVLYAATLVALLPCQAVAKMGSGEVSVRSSDVDIEMFGTFKSYPHFMGNVDFNSDHTSYDRILDENGWMKDHSIRNEIRMGWQGSGKNWGFLLILEADFTLNKANVDRGEDGTSPVGIGMHGDDFGVEKLDFSYDFGLVKLNTGWNNKFIDINSGGILYGDDHPYIGLSGSMAKMKWEALYIIIQDEIDGSGGVFDGDALDWRAYSLRTAWKLDGGMTLAPFYMFSDNNDHDAQVHYLGVEGYGQLGRFLPRFEMVYALGDQDQTGQRNKDIKAFGLYGSLEYDVCPSFTPYLGGTYLSGDDDSTDDELGGFNGITNISRYTATFGIENSFIHRMNPALGTHLYSNNFNLLGSGAGYGGIANSSTATSPGMVLLGVGCKGKFAEGWSYKTQFLYFQLAETEALEQVYGVSSISKNMGWEYDLYLTYTFNNHFSLGNSLAIFDPGAAVQDIRGRDYNELAYINTVEMKWQF